MDYTAWRIWLPLISIAISGGIAIYVHLSNKRTAKEAQLTKMKDRLDTRINDHDARLVKVETACSQAPGHADMSAIHEKINDVGLQVSRMSGSLEALTNGVSMIQEFLYRLGKESGDGV